MIEQQTSRAARRRARPASGDAPASSLARAFPEREALAVILRGLPPFRRLSNTSVTAIAAEMRPRRLGAGAVLFRQHDPAREFCILAEGRLAIMVEGADADSPPVGVLEASSWFGEVGILTRQRRTATLVALSPCLIWSLSRRQFEAMFTQHPQMARNLIRTLSERIQEKDRDFLGQSSLAAERGRLLRENARLYAEVKKKATQLEVASQHKSQFLARMSHELRTPLNAIIGFSEILAKGDVPVTPEEQQEFLESILGAGRHLLRLINDILDLSKVEAGKMELSPVPLCLADVAAEVLATVQPLASGGQVRLGNALPPDLPLVRADPRRVTQILYNLLSNAIKFTPPGGSVSVSARRASSVEREASPESLHAPPSTLHEFVEISVSDTGTGIRAEDQERIFEEFEQTEATRSKPGGTGLGLALVKRLVGMHGGKVGMVSRPGAGSTFTFTLPVAEMAHGS